MLSSDKITRRQQRELGILPRDVLSRLRELAEERAIDKDMSCQDIAAVLMIDLCLDPEFAATWQNVHEGTYGVDWDALADFLERVVELLLKILPLFI